MNVTLPNFPAVSPSGGGGRGFIPVILLKNPNTSICGLLLVPVCVSELQRDAEPGTKGFASEEF